MFFVTSHLVHIKIMWIDALNGLLAVVFFRKRVFRKLYAPPLIEKEPRRAP